MFIKRDDDPTWSKNLFNVKGDDENMRSDVRSILKKGTCDGATCTDTENALEDAIRVLHARLATEVADESSSISCFNVQFYDDRSRVTRRSSGLWHEYLARVTSTMFHVGHQRRKSGYSFFGMTNLVEDASATFEMLCNRIRHLSIEVLGEEDTHYMDLVAKAWNELVNNSPHIHTCRTIDAMTVAIYERMEKQ